MNQYQYLVALSTTLLFILLLWAMCSYLNRLADKLLVKQARVETTSNADRRWAVRMYDASLTARKALLASFVGLVLFALMH